FSSGVPCKLPCTLSSLLSPLSWLSLSMVSSSLWSLLCFPVYIRGLSRGKPSDLQQFRKENLRQGSIIVFSSWSAAAASSSRNGLKLPIASSRAPDLPHDRGGA
ncbi:hypothetical protein DFH08DRAFT_887538, partial [Mycena albidolilacea]